MAVYTYLARNINTTPARKFNGSPYDLGFLSGGADALDSADMTGSYVEAEHYFTVASWTVPTFFLSGPPLPDIATIVSLEWELQWRKTDENDLPDQAFGLRSYYLDAGFGGWLAPLLTTASSYTVDDGWITETLISTLTPDKELLRDTLDENRVIGIQTVTSSSFNEKTVQVSKIVLRVYTPGIRPLRQRQRDDGLSLSTKRARTPTSRQGSNRARGYI